MLLSILNSIIWIFECIGYVHVLLIASLLTQFLVRVKSLNVVVKKQGNNKCQKNRFQTENISIINIARMIDGGARLFVQYK